MRNTERHRCKQCRQHRALFCINGHWKADRQHDLCVRCYRSMRDSVRASSLSLQLREHR